jgi:hypothetical protein
MFDHDQVLEAMRTQRDHAERPEPQEPEKNTSEWYDCLEAAFKSLCEDYGDVIATDILETGTVSNQWRVMLRAGLAAELAKRAK